MVAESVMVSFFYGGGRSSVSVCFLFVRAFNKLLGLQRCSLN